MGFWDGFNAWLGAQFAEVAFGLGFILFLLLAIGVFLAVDSFNRWRRRRKK